MFTITIGSVAVLAALAIGVGYFIYGSIQYGDVFKVVAAVLIGVIAIVLLYSLAVALSMLVDCFSKKVIPSEVAMIFCSVPIFISAFRFRESIADEGYNAARSDGDTSKRPCR